MLELEDFKAIRKAVEGVTINDVILAISFDSAVNHSSQVDASIIPSVSQVRQPTKDVHSTEKIFTTKTPVEM